MSHVRIEGGTGLTLHTYRNQRGLAQYLLKQRAISSASDLAAFIHGFSNSGLAFSIIDTGESEQSADQALKIHFDHLIKDDYLFLGGLHSSTNARLLLTYHPLLRDKVILLQTGAKNRRDPAYNAVKGSERRPLETVVSEGLFAEDTKGAAVAMDAFYADWEEEERKEHGELHPLHLSEMVLIPLPQRRARPEGEGHCEGTSAALSGALIRPSRLPVTINC